ncbi:hypothetical protein UY3_09726 [Chelonia mydas]|uniref:Uncharacterized protein n=1 Tax=Chelonia mydas TaxID=8469 RepID=M7B7Q2_CHEMY|nr:hypothetical protein UY3_09726 [Chelonia mydas]
MATTNSVVLLDSLGLPSGPGSEPGIEIQICVYHIGINCPCAATGTGSVSGNDSFAAALSSAPTIPAPAASASSACQPHEHHNPLGAEGSDQGHGPVFSSSSFSDKAVVGTSMAPALEDSRVLQQLLYRVAQNLGIQVEEVVEDADPMVDILAPTGPSPVKLPLIKTISEITKNFVADTGLLALHSKEK